MSKVPCIDTELEPQVVQTNLSIHLSPEGVKTVRSKEDAVTCPHPEAEERDEIYNPSDTSGCSSVGFDDRKTGECRLGNTSDQGCFSTDSSSYSRDEETEESVEFDRQNFHRSPYMLRSSKSLSTSPEPGPSGEGSSKPSPKLLKKRPSFGTFNDCNNMSISAQFNRFTNTTGRASYSLEPIVEVEEAVSSQPHRTSRKPCRRFSSGTVSTTDPRPHVLYNINVCIPKGFVDKKIPLNFNLIEDCSQKDNPNEDTTNDSDKSINSPTFQIEMGEGEERRNSTLISEERLSTRELVDPLESENLEQPDGHHAEDAPVERPLAECPLDATLVPDDRPEPESRSPVPGPSQPVATEPPRHEAEEPMNRKGRPTGKAANPQRKAGAGKKPANKKAPAKAQKNRKGAATKTAQNKEKGPQVVVVHCNCAHHRTRNTKEKGKRCCNKAHKTKDLKNASRNRRRYDYSSDSDSEDCSVCGGDVCGSSDSESSSEPHSSCGSTSSSSSFDSSSDSDS